MKKTMIFSITIVLLLAGSVMPTAAQTRIIMIPAGFVSGEHYNLVQGEEAAALGHVYMASYPRLVRQFIECVNFSVTLFDEQGNEVMNLSPDEVRTLWTKPTPKVFAIFNDNGIPRTPFSQAFWSVPISDLPVGDYEMHTVLEFAHALGRGCDLDGDGKVDIFLPEEFNKEYVVYVHVTDSAGSGGGMDCLVGKCLP